jgi:kinesin family protein 5
MPDNVTVCLRFRPPNAREIEAGSTSVIEDIAENRTVYFRGEKVVPFSFDRVYGPESAQSDVFNFSAKPCVDSVLNGFNTTIFAYGQTGSGKTHTMMGVVENEELRGIIPRVVQAIFSALEGSVLVQYTVKVSYVEIYNEKIQDLLSPGSDSLKVRDNQHGVYIEGVTETYVDNFEHVLDCMRTGQNNRAIAATNMNLESSRSHSVFMLSVGQLNTKTGTKKGAKLILVDLAGSEKVAKTGAAGQTLKEAQHINKSLSALGNVINALTTGQKHIPYRDSKLTRLLSDSLGGNSKTCLVVTASPMSFNSEETLSTLRFGTRAKAISNKPKANVELSVAQYKELLSVAESLQNAANAQIEALRTDVAALLECLNALSEDVRGAVPQLRSDQPLQPRAHDVETRVEVNAELEFASLESQLRALTEENAQLEGDVRDKTMDIERSKADIRRLTAQQQAVEHKLQSFAAKEEELAIAKTKLSSLLKERDLKKVESISLPASPKTTPPTRKVSELRVEVPVTRPRSGTSPMPRTAPPTIQRKESAASTSWWSSFFGSDPEPPPPPRKPVRPDPEVELYKALQAKSEQYTRLKALDNERQQQLNNYENALAGVRRQLNLRTQYAAKEVATIKEQIALIHSERVKFVDAEKKKRKSSSNALYAPSKGEALYEFF